MAWMNQERKKTLAMALAPLKKQGYRYTLGVRNNSTIVLALASGPADFMTSYIESTGREFDWHPFRINPYHYRDHFSGPSREVLDQIIVALNTGNHDNSHYESDYYDVGWYVDVSIGTSKKPYQVTV